MLEKTLEVKKLKRSVDNNVIVQQNRTMNIYFDFSLSFRELGGVGGFTVGGTEWNPRLDQRCIKY